jgi:DNA-binding phage protein
MTITASYDVILKQALKSAKDNRGMSRKDVVERSGVSMTSIENWLVRKSEPSMHLLTAVVNTCGHQLVIKLGDL